MNHSFKIGLSSLFLLFSLVIKAQDDSDSTPKFSNEFLNIGVGAEALGMSNAYVAKTDDVYSGYWNPTGLLSLNELQGAAMHSEYFAGIAKYDYLGVAKPLDSLASAGFSVIRFGVDDIPNTTQLIDEQGNLDYDRITTFSAADYAFIFSYARKLKSSGWSYGGNAKIIYRRIGDFANAFGFGLDAALRYKHKKWVYSAVARDITTTVNSWSFDLSEDLVNVFNQTGNEIPEGSQEYTLPRVIVGAMRNVTISEKLTLQAEVDALITTDGKRNVLVSGNPLSLDPVIGFNMGYKNTLFLRGGVGNFQRVTSLVPLNPISEEEQELQTQESITFQPNFGIGLKLKKLSIDYALTDIGNVSDALFSNVFSLKILF